MEESQKEALIQRLIGAYKMDGNRLVSEAVELQVCKRNKMFLHKGQAEKYLMLNRLEDIEFVEDKERGENKPYISSLYPTKKKNAFEFSVNGSYFELVMKSQEDIEIKEAGSILEFAGGAK
jgi:hypothetical protein